MASLGKTRVQYKNEAGNIINFESVVTVTREGIFYASIPEQYAEDISQICIKNFDEETRYTSTFGFARHKGKWRFHSTTRAACFEWMKKCFDLYLEATVKKELVVCYQYANRCHFWEGEDGVLYPSGGHPSPRGRWANCEGSYPMREARESYTLGFKARIYQKVTTSRGVSVVVQYESPEEGELGVWGIELNRFVHLGVSAATQTPYNETVAENFYKAMLSLCEMSRVITGLFEDHKKVVGMLNGKGGLLLQAPK